MTSPIPLMPDGKGMASPVPLDARPERHGFSHAIEAQPPGNLLRFPQGIVPAFAPTKNNPAKPRPADADRKGMASPIPLMPDGKGMTSPVPLDASPERHGFSHAIEAQPRAIY